MRSLNVKDPEAHRLAAAIARKTGETMTRVVTEPLRERFERLPSQRAKAGVDELRVIAKRAAFGELAMLIERKLAPVLTQTV